MAAEPIGVDVFNIPRHVLSNRECLVSLDRGCSLTKLAFVPKSAMEDKESQTLPLTCALFLNKDFEQGLEWVKQRAYLPEGGVMRVTGVGGVKYEEMITKILGLKTEFIDEFAAQCEGLKFLVNNLSTEEICYPKVKIENTEVIEKSEMMEKIMESFNTAMPNENEAEKWPALFVFVGSGGGIVLVNKEQKFKMIGGVPLAGKTFIGLSKLLMRTTNFDEIMELANSGDRQNIDTQVKEILNDDANSPYGRFPPDMPIFPFGKPADLEKNREDFNNADIASSLAALCAQSVIVTVMIAASLTKTPRVFMGGNLFRGEIFRKEIDNILALWGGFSLFKLEYIKTGHTGALGAMITKPGTEMNCLDI